MDGHTAAGREITEKGAVLFLELARKATSDVAALAESIGESARATRTLLAELLDMGLITQDEPGAPWKPVDPVGPLRKMITEAERDMSSARSRRDELSNLEDRLSRAYGFHVERDAEDRAIEVIHGVGEANARMLVLGMAAGRCLAMQPGPLLLDDDLQEPTIRGELSQLQRGLDDYILIDTERLSSPPAANKYWRLADAGSKVRVATQLPFRCVITESFAALPLTSDDDGSAGAMVIHASSVVHALTWLFEVIWRMAQPLPQSVDLSTDNPTLDLDEIVLLDFLALGMPDDAVARHLNVSTRTVRRRIGELAEKLGSASRFQLALRAVAEGWRDGSQCETTGE